MNKSIKSLNQSTNQLTNRSIDQPLQKNDDDEPPEDLPTSRKQEMTTTDPPEDLPRLKPSGPGDMLTPDWHGCIPGGCFVV